MPNWSGGLGCPCCGDIPTTDVCAQCAAVPLRWSVTVSGFVDNGGCNGVCDELNGTHILEHDPLDTNQCRWTGPGTASQQCDDGTSTGGGVWTLFYSSSEGFWRLSSPGVKTGRAAYKCETADFNCLSDTVFTLLVNNASCDGAPATLTITPAP